MTLRMIAPAAAYEQRIRGLQAAMEVFEEAGLPATSAESAFHRLAPQGPGKELYEASPALVRAAAVWRRATEAAQRHCAGGILTDALSFEHQVRDAGSSAAAGESAGETKQC